jgi:hypothetical protein
MSMYLNSLGVEAVCLDDKKPIRKCKIVAVKPDVILVPVTTISDEVLERITKIKSSVPRAKVLALSYVLSFTYFHQIVKSGADRCLVMPSTLFKIYSVMMELAGYTKVFKFDHYIVKFLIRNGIPSSTLGFKNLCSAICYCTLNPERTVHLPILYDMVAADNSTTGAAIELSLRRISAEIYKSDAYKNFTGGKTLDNRFTNYELLSLITDAFIAEYNIYPEKERIHGRDFIPRLKR